MDNTEKEKRERVRMRQLEKKIEWGKRKKDREDIKSWKSAWYCHIAKPVLWF